MARFTYTPNRVIDTDGISDGASIYFYATGTTTPVTIYSDAALTTPIANPVVVAAGAAVPAVYYADAEIRVRVVDSAGAVVSDDDPYDNLKNDLASANASKGSALVAYKRSETGAEANTLKGKADQVLNLLDFIPQAQRAAMLDRTTTYDASSEFQAAIDALGTEGGCIDISNMKVRVSSPLTVTYAIWKPVVIRGSGGSEIQSTHDGIVFDDSTAAIRLENIKMTGPGLANTSAIAVQSVLSRGLIRNCEFVGYRVGVDVTGSTNPVIERNRFTLCQEGVRSIQTSPNFSNIMTIRDNYFDFNTFGVYLDEVFGAVLENNSFEFNGVGVYLDNVRLFELAGSNWFEGNTTPYQIVGSCTGRIGRNTRFVSNTNPSTISWSTSKIIDEATPHRCIVQNSTTQSIAHNTTTSLTWDTEIDDPAALHSTSTNTDQVVITAPGLYLINLNVEMAAFTPVGGTEVVRININKNGTPLSYAYGKMQDAQATQLSASTYAVLTTGDIIRGQAYQNTGGALNASGGTVTQLSVVMVDTAS